MFSSRVVVVDADELGTPVIQYLAVVGIGEFIAVDDGMVERSNLQQQVVHCDSDVEMSKAESAAAFVHRLSPDMSIKPAEIRIDKSSVHEAVAGSDVVADAPDDFPTRYPLSDICCFRGIPLAHDAICKLEGQATALAPDGSCYRCLSPEAPEPGMIPGYMMTGVLGVLPGTVGCIQATKAMRFLLDEGEALDGRPLFHDTMDMTLKTVPYRINSGRPVCDKSRAGSIEDIDYVESCAISLD